MWTISSLLWGLTEYSLSSIHLEHAPFILVDQPEPGHRVPVILVCCAPPQERSMIPARPSRKKKPMESVMVVKNMLEA